MTATAARPETPTPEPLLDVRAVAEYLGCQPLFVYQIVRAQHLRHIRLGRSIRIPQSALVEFVAAGGVTTDQRAS